MSFYDLSLPVLLNMLALHVELEMPVPVDLILALEDYGMIVAEVL